MRFGFGGGLGPVRGRVSVGRGGVGWGAGVGPLSVTGGTRRRRSSDGTYYVVGEAEPFVMPEPGTTTGTWFFAIAAVVLFVVFAAAFESGWITGLIFGVPLLAFGIYVRPSVVPDLTVVAAERRQKEAAKVRKQRERSLDRAVRRGLLTPEEAKSASRNRLTAEQKIAAVKKKAMRAEAKRQSFARGQSARPTSEMIQQPEVFGPSATFVPDRGAIEKRRAPALAAAELRDRRELFESQLRAAAERERLERDFPGSTAHWDTPGPESPDAASNPLVRDDDRHAPTDDADHE